jgi:hypothetical protein
MWEISEHPGWLGTSGWLFLIQRRQRRQFPSHLLCVFHHFRAGRPWKFLPSSNTAGKPPVEFDDFPYIFPSTGDLAAVFPLRIPPNSAELIWPVPLDSRLACCCAVQRWPHRVFFDFLDREIGRVLDSGQWKDVFIHYNSLSWILDRINQNQRKETGYIGI